MQRASGMYDSSSVQFVSGSAGVNISAMASLDSAPVLNHSTARVDVYLDGHSHSTYSDGRMTVAELAQWHRFYGYTAFAVTDHQTTDGALATDALLADEGTGDGEPVLLIGQEYTTCRCHLNILGPAESFKPVKFPTDADIRSVIESAHAAGGVVVVNHLPWSQESLVDLPTREQWLAWGADFLEVANGATLDWQSFVFARRHGLGVMAGSDVHGAEAGAHGYTWLRPRNASREALMEELRARRSEILFEALPPRAAVTGSGRLSQWGVFLAPVVAWGQFTGAFYIYETHQYSFVAGFCTATRFALLGGVIAWGLVFAVCAFACCEAAAAAPMCVRWMVRRRGEGDFALVDAMSSSGASAASDGSSAIECGSVAGV